MIQQTQQQKQLLKFSPLQIQMLNLLHLSAHELEQKIKDEIESNPALEEAQPVEDSIQGEADGMPVQMNSEDTDMSFADAEVPEMAEFTEFYSDCDDDLPNYKEKSELDYYADEEYYTIPVVEDDTFHEKIKQQINLLPISDIERRKIHFLIDSLDDDGYLRSELGELADQYSFLNAELCEEEELKSALKKIQQCDPVGIGARNLQECLLLQLDRTKKNDPCYKVARNILTNHIFELENRNFDKIKRAMNIDQDTLRSSIALISKLNPKPNIFTDASTHTNQVIPEYAVRTENDNLIVSIINKNLPELRLNESVVKMVEPDAEPAAAKPVKKDKAAVRFFKNKLLSAKWLIDALKQREESMLKVMKAIAKFQYEFFMTGDYKTLRPMILKNIAELVELDISTVSRVTSTRYVQTDFGTIHLRELFTEAMSKENGDVVSNKEIQKIICDMLMSENKQEPLTDQQISDALKEEGYNLARRTVSKYRECLNIPIAKMRKAIA